jgi:hypothetical protein
MTILAFQSAIVFLSILLNGLFAMSETALVSARKASLRQRADAGDNRARAALEVQTRGARRVVTARVTAALAATDSYPRRYGPTNRGFPTEYGRPGDGAAARKWRFQGGFSSGPAWTRTRDLFLIRE